MKRRIILMIPMVAFVLPVLFCLSGCQPAYTDYVPDWYIETNFDNAGTEIEKASDPATAEVYLFVEPASLSISESETVTNGEGSSLYTATMSAEYRESTEAPSTLNEENFETDASLKTEPPEYVEESQTQTSCPETTIETTQSEKAPPVTTASSKSAPIEVLATTATTTTATATTATTTTAAQTAPCTSPPSETKVTAETTASTAKETTASLATTSPSETSPPLTCTETSPEETTEDIVWLTKNLYISQDNVSVYAEPNKEADLITSLNYGTKIYCEYISGKKWAKVGIEDKEGFVLIEYLSEAIQSTTASAAPEEPTSVDDGKGQTREGMIGRLYIDDLGINVALFGNSNNTNSVEYVNAEDSAVYIYGKYWWGYDVIGDHNYQGFDGLYYAVPGQTVAVIDCGEHSERYICTDVFKGYNSKALVHLDGSPTAWENNDGITMYTCNYGSDTITITYWQPI